MLAVQVRAFGGPEQLRVVEVEPPRPSPTQLRIGIRAAGVNPVDGYIRQGSHAVKPELPYVPGLDGAGTVLEVGSQVSGCAPGDRVYVVGAPAGTYAEQILCTTREVFPLPDNLSFAQGAALGVPCTTAYRALFTLGGAIVGETVLVRGASGGVGTATVQLARDAGLTVIGTAGTPAGRDLVLAQGAHHVLDHHRESLVDEIHALTDGRGVDLVVEMLADRNLGDDLRLLARKGRVAIVGSRGPVEIVPRDAMSREATIRGVFFFLASPDEVAQAQTALRAAAETGALSPVIGVELPLTEASSAHEAITAGGARGKVVLVVP